MRRSTAALHNHTATLRVDTHHHAADRLPQGRDDDDKQNGIALLSRGEVDAVIVDYYEGGERHETTDDRCGDLENK